MNAKQKTIGTALVTGGAKRIGRQIAFTLAEKGYHIALHYNRSKTEALKTSREIEDRGGTCVLYPANLSQEKELKAMIINVTKKQGPLTLLVNNASVFNKNKFQTSGLKSLQDNLAVHLIAPYILSREFSRRCKRGQIINMLDVKITDNQTQHFDYLLSKKALKELTLMLATALAPTIRVNAIAPGLILAPENKNNAYLSKLAKAIPLKKRGDTRNIIQAVNYLVDNTFVTGQILFIDGGEHLL